MPAAEVDAAAVERGAAAFERGAASSRARAMGREGTWHETVVSAGPALVSAGPTHSVERHEFFDLEIGVSRGRGPIPRFLYRLFK